MELVLASTSWLLLILSLSLSFPDNVHRGKIKACLVGVYLRVEVVNAGLFRRHGARRSRSLSETKRSKRILLLQQRYTHSLRTDTRYRSRRKRSPQILRNNNVLRRKSCDGSSSSWKSRSQNEEGAFLRKEGARPSYLISDTNEQSRRNVGW